MVVTLVKSSNYNNEQRTMNYSKQTQTNPIFLILIVSRVCGQPAIGQERKIPEVDKAVREQVEDGIGGRLEPAGSQLG